MVNRHHGAVAIAVWLAMLLSSATAERPNILMIVSEDNGPELGCYGEPSVTTPVLDRLAAEGVRFQNAYVPQAGCSQSRAALLTGLYPHQNGQIGLATWGFRMYRREIPNLVGSLRAAGYRTGLIGKLHVEPKSAFPFHTHEISSANFGRQNLARYAQAAAAFISAEHTPFFLSVNYPDAHRPLLARVRELPATPLLARDVRPLSYFGLDTMELRGDTANYYNCLSRLDSLIGELLSELARLDRADNTLVIFLGDHGADLLRGKRTSYEGGIRIPLIVRWPGQAQAGQVRKELVSTLDLTPTLLQIASAEPIDDLPGRSLVGLLRGTNKASRKFLFSEYHTHSAHNFYPQRTVRDARYKLIHNLQSGVNPGYDFTLERFFPKLPQAIAAAPRHIRASYERMRSPPEYELYDLQEDPHEFDNLAARPAVRSTYLNLKRQLEEWQKRTHDPLLDARNLAELKAEISACYVDGVPQKSRLSLNYGDYFFESR